VAEGYFRLVAARFHGDGDDGLGAFGGLGYPRVFDYARALDLRNELSILFCFAVTGVKAFSDHFRDGWGATGRNGQASERRGTVNLRHCRDSWPYLAFTLLAEYTVFSL
jgi:hypothetical protein